MVAETGKIGKNIWVAETKRYWWQKRYSGRQKEYVKILKNRWQSSTGKKHAGKNIWILVEPVAEWQRQKISKNYWNKFSKSSGVAEMGDFSHPISNQGTNGHNEIMAPSTQSYYKVLHCIKIALCGCQGPHEHGALVRKLYLLRGL